MNEPLLEHIGKKIKLYRKAKGMTLADLAAQINKSKATMSKYETGGISIDMVTLFDIAQALDIDPVRLTDYNIPKQSRVPSVKYPLGEPNLLYLYHMDSNTIFHSVITMHENQLTGKIEATLYYKADNLSSYEKCDCLYHGELRSHDAVSCFTFQNYYNSVESLVANYMVPMNKVEYLVGMLSGLHSPSFLPIGFKTILSAAPMRKDDTLREQLTLSKDVFKEMKTRNMLLI